MAQHRKLQEGEPSVEREAVVHAAAMVPAPAGSSACADAAVLLYKRALALQEQGYQQISGLFTRLINGGAPCITLTSPVAQSG